MFEAFSYYFTLAMAILVLCTFLGLCFYVYFSWLGDTLWRHVTRYHTIEGYSLLLGLLHQEGIRVTPTLAYKVVDFLQAEKIKEEENE